MTATAAPPAPPVPDIARHFRGQAHRACLAVPVALVEQAVDRHGFDAVYEMALRALGLDHAGAPAPVVFRYAGRLVFARPL